MTIIVGRYAVEDLALASKAADRCSRARCGIVGEGRGWSGLLTRRDDRRQRGAVPGIDWHRLLPEGLAALLLAAIQPNLLSVLCLPFLIRWALFAAIGVHGLGHALAGGRGGARRILGYLAQVSPRALLPFGPLFIPGFSAPEQAPCLSLDGLSRTRRRAVALGGPFANAVLLLLSMPLLLFVSMPLDLAEIGLIVVVAANLWTLATSWTDYATSLSGVGDSVFCGNFGILAKRNPRESGFLPKRFRLLTERLGQQTDIRGQQAAGVAVLGANGRFVGRKIVNDKRGNLTERLLRAFRRRAAVRRVLLGARPQHGVFHLVAHYRYGTSSQPSEIETHWHRWLPPRIRPVWSVDEQALSVRRRVVENLITHNGDFDAWRVLGVQTSYSEIGTWLGEVLGVKHPAQGDSPKIAGLLDLLLTQGQWDASLRLAYALRTGQALPLRLLKGLTQVFEQVFAGWAEGAIEPRPRVAGCNSLEQVYCRNPDAIQSLIEKLQQASLAVTRDWPEAAKPGRAWIITEAVRVFFHNDLYEATRCFMVDAKGTFGLITTSGLAPGVVVLAADRQPLFVATEPEVGLLLYASEAAALKSALGCGCAAGTVDAAVYRYDLHDGDIVLLRAREGTADNTMTVRNIYVDAPPNTQRITAETLEVSARDKQLGGWIALRDNPCVEPAPPAGQPKGIADRVQAEMLDIPAVLDRIHREWDDPMSLNRCTAQEFTEALLHNACAGPSCCHALGGPSLSPTLDLLILGVENNFTLGQRFAADLRRVYPLLHVAAVDAVSYSEDPRRYAVGISTVTLAISQSGQTFNTLDAVKFLQTLHGLHKAGLVFAMTGEIDTRMGAALGQSVKSGAPWIARIFTTGAGWRTAEPATVSTAATHATLTQLLLRLQRDTRGLCSGQRLPFGMATSKDDLKKLDALARLSVSRAEALLGRTAEGWSIQTADGDALRREGGYVARLLIEPALVFIFTAVHLFVMLWLGWNPVMGLAHFLQAQTGWAIFDNGNGLVYSLSVVLQTGYFLFAGAAFTLILRWVQQRPLWDRVFVGRTLVIGEEPYVKDLLAQFVSKLFSLAYEFTGFVGIHAADARSGELLHGYGHRITRGLLLFLGLPDGRWCGRERAEAAACMTSRAIAS